MEHPVHALAGSRGAGVQARQLAGGVAAAARIQSLPRSLHHQTDVCVRRLCVHLSQHAVGCQPQLHPLHCGDRRDVSATKGQSAQTLHNRLCVLCHGGDADRASIRSRKLLGAAAPDAGVPYILLLHNTAALFQRPGIRHPRILAAADVADACGVRVLHHRRVCGPRMAAGALRMVQLRQCLDLAQYCHVWTRRLDTPQISSRHFPAGAARLSTRPLLPTSLVAVGNSACGTGLHTDFHRDFRSCNRIYHLSGYSEKISALWCRSHLAVHLALLHRRLHGLHNDRSVDHAYRVIRQPDSRSGRSGG